MNESAGLISVRCLCVALLCLLSSYPQGLRLETGPTPPLLHSFVMTMATGSRLYAYVYTKWIQVPDHVLTVVKMQVANTLIDSVDPNPTHLPSTLYGPHSLVVISAHPFYDSLGSMLKLVATKFFMHNVPHSSGSGAFVAPPAFHPSLPASTQLIDALYSAFGDVAPVRVPLSEMERRALELCPLALEFRDAVTRLCAKGPPRTVTNTASRRGNPSRKKSTLAATTNARQAGSDREGAADAAAVAVAAVAAAVAATAGDNDDAGEEEDAFDAGGGSDDGDDDDENSEDDDGFDEQDEHEDDEEQQDEESSARSAGGGGGGGGGGERRRRPLWLEPLHAPVSPDPSTLLAQLNACCQMCLTHLPFLLPAAPLFDNLPCLEASVLGALFDSLSLTHVLQVWNAVLCELPCLFVSAEIQKLTPALESLAALLYPMKWPYVYIPVLPIFLTDVLDAPQPFLIGAPREVLQQLPDAIVSGETNIVIVDLDRDAVCMSGNLQATLRREAKARVRARWAAMGVTPSSEAVAAAAEGPQDLNPFPDPFLVHARIVALLLANQGLSPSDDGPGPNSSSNCNSNSNCHSASLGLKQLLTGSSSCGSGSGSGGGNGSGGSGGAACHRSMATLSSDPSSLTASCGVPLTEEALDAADGHHPDGSGSGGANGNGGSGGGGGNGGGGNGGGGDGEEGSSGSRHVFLPWNLLWRLFDGVGSVLNPLRLAQQEAARERAAQWERDQALATKYASAATPSSMKHLPPAHAQQLLIQQEQQRTQRQQQRRGGMGRRAPPKRVDDDLAHYSCGMALMASLPPNLPTHAWPVILPGLVRELKASIVAGASGSGSSGASAASNEGGGGWSFLGLGGSSSSTAAAASSSSSSSSSVSGSSSRRAGSATPDLDSLADESLWSSLSYLGNESFFLAKFATFVEKSKKPVLLLSTARFLYSGTDVSSSEGELLEHDPVASAAMHAAAAAALSAMVGHGEPMRASPFPTARHPSRPPSASVCGGSHSHSHSHSHSASSTPLASPSHKHTSPNDACLSSNTSCRCRRGEHHSCHHRSNSSSSSSSKVRSHRCIEVHQPHLSVPPLLLPPRLFHPLPRRRCPPATCALRRCWSLLLEVVALEPEAALLPLLLDRTTSLHPPATTRARKAWAAQRQQGQEQEQESQAHRHPQEVATLRRRMPPQRPRPQLPATEEASLVLLLLVPPLLLLLL